MHSDPLSITMKLSSMHDDEFIIDKVEVKKTIFGLVSPKKKDARYMSYKFSSISAFSTCWPYLVFSGLYNNVMITNTKDLFLMIKKNHVYELLYLDLEELNYFKY